MIILFVILGTISLRLLWLFRMSGRFLWLDWVRLRRPWPPWRCSGKILSRNINLLTTSWHCIVSNSVTLSPATPRSSRWSSLTRLSVPCWRMLRTWMAATKMCKFCPIMSSGKNVCKTLGVSWQLVTKNLKTWNCLFHIFFFQISWQCKCQCQTGTRDEH